MRKHVKTFAFLRSGIFWTAFSGIATLVLCGVAYFQLNESNREARDSNKIASETFLHSLKSDFFTPEARKIFLLLEMDALKFKVIPDNADSSKKSTLGVFEIKAPLGFKEYLKPISSDRTFYFDDEIDEVILNHFEDLGKMCKENLIDRSDIYEDFGYYITTSHENAEIKKYIKWLRDQDITNVDMYQNFDFIDSLVNPKKL